MTKNLTIFALMGVILLTTSCASIVSKSTYPISINSTPSHAKITITDKEGIEIYTGQTPAIVDLKSGNGYFGKARYQVKIETLGYEPKTVPVEFKLDGWYFGNIVFGGVIGLLIVDPATGAMYKLETEFINENLVPSIASEENNELKLYTLNDIPSEWVGHLVEITK